MVFDRVQVNGSLGIWPSGIKNTNSLQVSSLYVDERVCDNSKKIPEVSTTEGKKIFGIVSCRNADGSGVSLECGRSSAVPAFLLVLYWLSRGSKRNFRLKIFPYSRQCCVATGDELSALFFECADLFP